MQQFHPSIYEAGLLPTIARHNIEMVIRDNIVIIFTSMFRCFWW